jgi:hypothetical protein
MVILVACGEGATKVERGDLVEGTVTASDSTVDGWKSKPYLITIFENVEYFIRLTSPTGTPVGLWNPVAEEFIVEVDRQMMGRTVAYTFAEGDSREIFVRSLDSDVPAPFTFTFWIRAS